MHLYAGHPQYVYYTAVAVLLYALLHVFFVQGLGRQVLAFLLLSYFSAAFLSAVQLLPGLAASADSVRSSGLSLEFAAMFSFPPENIITLIAPVFLATISAFPIGAGATSGRCLCFLVSRD